MKGTVLFATIVATFAAVLVSSASARTTHSQIVVARQQYYHADGYIKAIGHVARRTIYHPNYRIRTKWRRALHYLVGVRHRAYLVIHPPAPPPPVIPPVKPQGASYWAGVQIGAATRIAQSSGGDPWPNCPDPYDGSGGSWYDTVACENGGNWLDSPGYYRCGLQFDPAWEVRFGYKFCP